MAKIQYIRSPQIEFSTPSSNFGQRPVQPPKRTDPALMILGGIGIGGIVIAIVALLFTIVAIQSRKDAVAGLSLAFNSRYVDSRSFLAKYLTPVALEKYDTAMKVVVAGYGAGKITDRKLNKLLDSMWQSFLEKEPSRQVMLLVISEARNAFEVPPPEVLNAMEFFERSADGDVMQISTTVTPPEFTLFRNPGENSEANPGNNSGPYVSPDYGNK
ncbi:MAG: hypothetical protein WC712_12605 [Candidatus Brocadiia bacterium]